MLEPDHWILSVHEHPELLELLREDNPPISMSLPSPPFPFVSSRSANAIISDLRPTTLSLSALLHLNLLLDEIIVALLTAAGSLNPKDLRTNGVPAVISGEKGQGESTGIRALGRAAVADAEVEARSWYELQAGSRTGYPPAGKGRGLTQMKEESGAPFPLEIATDLIRMKCASFSTFSPDGGVSDQQIQDIMVKWKLAGGDVSDPTIEPVSMWMTGLLEHICDRVLRQTGQVIARDSSVTMGNVQHFYTALAEDESVWGFVRRLRVKDSLEEAVRIASSSKNKRGTPIKSPHGRSSPMTNSPHGSKTSLGTPNGARDASIDSTSNLRSSPSYDAGAARGSVEASRFSGISGVTRKTSTMSKRLGGANRESGLNVSTRSANSLREQGGEKQAQSSQDDEDEFDALVRSNETMKVSLTPSRLRTFESPNSGKRHARSGSNPIEHATGDLFAIPRSESVPLYSSLAKEHQPMPINAIRSRSNSLMRLEPRPANTIQEMSSEDEEEKKMPRQNRKQTMKQWFDSHQPEDFHNSETPRTVPAVVLGSAPPSSFIAPTPATISRKGSFTNRTTPREATDNTRAGSSSERSDARELADFFASTPPPPGNNVRPTEPPLSAKSTKGFRGLMNKMTGGSKKKDEERRLAHEASLMDAPPNKPKHQKSMSSFVGSTVSTAPPSMFRPQPSEADTALLPPRTLARKASNASQRSTSVDVGVPPATSSSSAGPVEADEGPLVPSARTTTPPQTALHAMTSSPSRSSSLGVVPSRPQVSQIPVPFSARQDVSKAEKRNGAEGTNAAGTRQASNDPREDKSYGNQVSLAPVVVIAPERAASPDRPSYNDRTPTNVSEANSFVTANEGGDDDIQADSAQSVTGTEADTIKDEAATAIPPLQPALAITEPPSSMPLSSLVPLRGLLDHATSVGECRMLLSAVLTQLGVPRHADTAHPTVTPESRIVAWLLAGGEGPPVQLTQNDTPSSSRFTAGDDGEDEPITPAMANMELSRSNEDAEGTPKVSRIATQFGSQGLDKEELISETASYSSVTDEVEEMQMGYAKAGQRSSPVELAAGQ